MKANYDRRRRAESRPLGRTQSSPSSTTRPAVTRTRPSSVTRTRSFSSSKDGGEDRASVTDSESSMTEHTNEMLAKWVEEAQEFVNKHSLLAAQHLFYKVLHCLRDDHADKNRHIILSLIGLGEVYAKQTRYVRDNEMEWYWMFIRSIMLQRTAVSQCESVMQESSPSREECEWLLEQRESLLTHLAMQEDILVKALHTRLVPEDAKKVADQFFVSKWLENLEHYCISEISNKDFIKKIQREIDPSLELAVAQHLHAEETRSTSSTSSSEKSDEQRKVHLDKVSKVLQRVVKQMSSEIRGNQDHTDHLEKRLYRMKSQENLIKLHLMSPRNETDMMKKFEIALMEEEIETGERVLNPIDETNGSTENSPVPESPPQFEDWRAAIQQRFRSPISLHILPLTANNPWQSLVSGSSQLQSSSSKKCEQKTLGLPQSGLSSGSDIESSDTDEDYRGRGTGGLTGILRVWSAYPKLTATKLSPSQMPYRLKMFEEFSPITEFSSFPGDLKDNNSEDLSLLEKIALNPGLTRQSMAFILSKLGKQLAKGKRLKMAYELHKFALGLFCDTVSCNIQVEAVADTLRNIGMIKCMKHDIESGAKLLEEAVQLFSVAGDDLSCANVWFDLGKVFLAESLDEGTLFEHVMNIIREDLDNEFKQTPEEHLGGGDEDSDDEDEEGSYSVCTQEALQCFKNALEILHERPVMTNERASLLIEVFTRLGDCSVLDHNYDRATVHYEEALHLCKNTYGSETLPNNAHILTMLGTVNYLLCRYTKAVTMFECASVMQQHLRYQNREATFEVAFTLTMLGFTYYVTRHYQKCISWCLKAFDMYNNLYNKRLTTLRSIKRWFVTQTVYILGFAYSTLGFKEKSLNHLLICQTMVKDQESSTKQVVRILKSIADVYCSMEDNEKALQYYNEALEFAHSLGDEKSTNALQNQLLNRMAGVHVNTKNYDTAAEYLEQALDHQKTVQSSIKDDLVDMMAQLGITYSLAGDIDRAIESYHDCVDAYMDMSSIQNPANYARVLGCLATLYHVKACMCDELEEAEFLEKAEDLFKEAIKRDSHSSVCVQYANYLYQQGLSADALLSMLTILYKNHHRLEDIVYYGVSEAVLPEQLSPELDDLDEVVLDAKVFSKFLAVLCFKQLQLWRDASDTLVDMYNSVASSDRSFNHSMLGHTMMELHLFAEAADCFHTASQLQEESNLPTVYSYFAYFTHIYETICRTVFMYMDYTDAAVVKRKRRPRQLVSGDTTSDERPRRVRDSGYYDHVALLADSAEIAKSRESLYAVETISTPMAILEVLRSSKGSRTPSDEQEDMVDKGYTSSEHLARTPSHEHISEEVWSSPTLSARSQDQDASSESSWIVEEEVIVDVPTEVLSALSMQNTRTQQVTYEDQDYQNDEWTVEEEVVETPVEILQMMQSVPSSSLQSEEADIETDESAEWVVEEETLETPVEVLRALQNPADLGTPGTASADDQSDSESYSWHVSEEVVETPDVLLQVLQQGARHTPVEDPGTSATTPDEDVWVTFDEETTETPVAVMQILEKQQHEDLPVEEPGTDSGWTVEEEVVITTPMSTFDEGYQNEDNEEVWITEEVVVETPAEVLQMMARRSNSGGSGSSNKIVSPVRERREVVPSASMNRSINNNNHNSDERVDNMNNILNKNNRTVRAERERSPVIETSNNVDKFSSRWSHTYGTRQYNDHDSKHQKRSTDNGNGVHSENKHNRHTVFRGGRQQPSFESHHSSQGVRSEEVDNEEVYEVWETQEEVVETPPELLAILAAQQRRQ